MTDGEASVDPDLHAAVDNALSSFEGNGKEAEVKTSMAYDEQCARALVNGLGRDSEMAKTLRRAMKEAGGWSMEVVHETFPHLPAIMLVSHESLKLRLKVYSALTMGSKAPLVGCFYQARSLLDVCPQNTAVFMRTIDWGNIVVHGLVWAGDDTLRASIPRILIPAKGQPGEVLVIEARKTFIKFLARLAFFD